MNIDKKGFELNVKEIDIKNIYQELGLLEDSIARRIAKVEDGIKDDLKYILAIKNILFKHLVVGKKMELHRHNFHAKGRGEL